MKDRFQTEILKLKRDILTSCYQAGAGHIPSSFSIVETLYILYKYFLNKNQNDFILSKGHAAPALYTVLKKFKVISHNDYTNYCKYGSQLTSHPSCYVPGIQFSSGALGLGLSVGIGMALANNLKKDLRNVFVLMGDGELNEGSVWEALIYAGDKKIPNIVCIIDKNNLQASNFTDNIIKTQPLINAIREIGWSVYEAGGHDLDEIKDKLTQGIDENGPFMLVLETIKGKGVSFMENNPVWHHKIPNQHEYQSALRELNL